jgi:hypothetical protein
MRPERGHAGAALPTVERGSIRRLIVATALGFVVLVTVSMGVAALIIGFDPLSALTYAFSYGLVAVVGLVALAAVLWLLIAPGRSTVGAIREWREIRDARTALRVLGLAVWTAVAASIVIGLVLIAVASST